MKVDENGILKKVEVKIYASTISNFNKIKIN